MHKNNTNKKINYHTFLPYTEIHEQHRIEEEIERTKDNQNWHPISQEDILLFQKQSLLVASCLKSSEVTLSREEYYHDIVNSDSRPDYKTIEVICLMGYRCIHDDERFCTYNGYKVKPLSNNYGFYFYIHLGLLIELGSNLNLHLLSYFLRIENEEEYLTIKTSYIKLQEFFNETEGNIKHALVSLQNLNLITFFKENNGDLIINLNKDNILKLEKKHTNYSDLEEDFAINDYYGMALIEPQCPHCFEKLDIDLIFKHYQKFKND